MDSISVPAHFDGERILLDEPIELAPNTRLIVTILPNSDEEHEAWLQLSMKGLSAAYSEDEEEYSLDSVKEANPEYEGR
jgi:hypothetical protein